MRTRETQNALKTQKDAETANGLYMDLSIGDHVSTNRRAASRIRAPREVSRTIRFEGIHLRDLADLADRLVFPSRLRDECRFDLFRGTGVSDGVSNPEFGMNR
jgi:hypothetical protein